ncbi:hypothetical protein Chor_000822 [Crotalus horridus]
MPFFFVSFLDFQLNSHLSTLANIHKIYHTLNRLINIQTLYAQVNLTEDTSQDDHQTGNLRSCSSSDSFSKVMPPRKKRRPTAGDDLTAKKSRHDGVYRKYDSTRIRSEDDMFSSKRCLEWFYEYAGKYSRTDEVVGPEGMEKFCEDIGVEPENVRSSSSIGPHYFQGLGLGIAFLALKMISVLKTRPLNLMDGLSQ